MMSNGRTTLALPPGLARILDGVRRRSLGLRVAEFPVLLLAFLAVAWVLQATADRWLELSWNTRAILLGLDTAAVLVLLGFFVIAPLRRRLDRRKAALLVERTLPQFRTSLISAVEFAERGSEYPAGSQPLVQKLLDDAARQAEQEDVVKRVVRPDRLRRFTKWMIAALVIAAVCFVAGRPLSPLLVQRILLSQTPFPDETKVVGVTGDFVVIAGTDAVLTARAEGEIPAAGRLLVAPENGPAETIAVTPSRTENGVFHYTVRNVRGAFAYHFELNDGIGASHRVGVRVPPSLKEIKFVQIYPRHTGLPETVMSPANLRLLAGSKLRIEALGSEALQSAVLEIKGADETLPLEISGNDKDQVKAELTVPERGWKSMSIHLVGTSGEVSANDPVYRIDLVIDKPPVVSVSQPKKDTITVIAGAKVPFVFKISDDFGLKRAALSYRVFRPGLGGTMEPAEEGELPVKFEPGEKSFSRTLDWDLARLVPAVGIGCYITCSIEAEDNNSSKNAAITRSAEKTITIVSEEQKRMELLDLLGERAKDIERLYELQRGMNEKTDDSIR